MTSKGDAIYQVGGSLRFDAPTYVARWADQQLYDAIRAGELCCIFNARQMGKSSLRVHLQQRLQAEGIRCAYLDMTRIGSEQVDADAWYRGIMVELLRSFQLFDRIDLKQWWNAQADLPILQQLSLFIEDILLRQIDDQNICILVDEIDSALSLPFAIDDFFALIRSCYNQRALDEQFQRLDWALFGVTTPSDLIQDRTRTPFNIGRTIALQGIQLDEATPLLAGFPESCGYRQKVLESILAWTAGQPFLSQKLCQILVRKLRNGEWPEQGDHNQAAIAQVVEDIIQAEIIEHWETRDQPEHFRTIRDRLLRDELMSVRLLGRYQQILEGVAVKSDDSREQIELILSGLIVIDGQGNLRVKNRIYAQIFTLEWVTQQLSMLRPYARQLKLWRDSNCQDETLLLTGETLTLMLEWAQDKRLSDMDYRFLNASQSLTKRMVESALAIEQQAREESSLALQLFQDSSAKLAAWRQEAKRVVRQQGIGWRWMGMIISGVSLSLFGLRATGSLQELEWMVGDRLVQLRPVEPMSQEITIISVGEADLRTVGQFPLPDGVLAEAIQRIQQYQPQQIAIDIYRDLPIAPGQAELQQVFRKTPNLWGIDKVVAPIVAAPPILATKNQVGFVDQVIDRDGKVRRALLSVKPAGQATRYSLGLQLALNFLEGKGIKPEVISNRTQAMRLGKLSIQPFAQNDAGYVRAETGGYQILLNYYGTLQQFPVVSLQSVLRREVKSQLLRDKIVLIGYTAESVNDLFQTPYSSGTMGQYMPGVVLHANITQQLISGALTGRTLQKSLDESVEWFWIVGWIGLACFSSQGLVRRQWWWLPMSLGFMVAVLFASVYGALLLGWWLPLVPCILGMLTGPGLVLLISQRQAERRQLQYILERLSQDQRITASSRGFILALLKQGESPEGQQLIEQYPQFDLSNQLDSSH